MNQIMAAVWDEHVTQEFVAHDVDATMATMAEDPHLNLVPTMAVGPGKEEVRTFYSTQFIPCLPPDVAIVPISRTVGDDQLVDEMILSFTHTIEMPWILPGIPPTHRRVEVPLVVIARFDGDKMVHEHIYWDGASVLKQIGLLDNPALPVLGAESAQRLRESAGAGGA
jgi:carboxymethylenebutenolidase